MLPFGKQKEIFNFLSTADPEELSRNRRDLFMEDDVV
jgi:hypothetical protein